MKTITTILLALTLFLTAAAAANAATAVHYLRSHQTASGGFAEAGSGSPSVAVTDWTMMGLRAAGVSFSGRVKWGLFWRNCSCAAAITR